MSSTNKDFNTRVEETGNILVVIATLVGLGIAGLGVGFAALAIASPGYTCGLLPENFCQISPTIVTNIVTATPDPDQIPTPQEIVKIETQVVQVPSTVVVTREVPGPPLEVTRIVEVPFEITKIVEIPVEVTRIVEVTPIGSTSVPTTQSNADLFSGGWGSQNGVMIKVDTELNSSRQLEVWIRVSNGTSRDLAFQWIRSQNFSLTDNNGVLYPSIREGRDTTKTQVINPNENREVDYITYEVEGVFSGTVTDLYFTANNFAGTSRITWRIPIQ